MAKQKEKKVKAVRKYNYLKKTGRPTKYLPDVIYPMITEYIDMCSRENTELPTIEGLAIKLQVNPDTIFTWVKKYPEFSESIKEIAARQKNQLMNDGLYGGKEVNHGMAIFLLKVNHGMIEQPSTAVQVNVFAQAAKDADKYIDGEEV